MKLFIVYALLITVMFGAAGMRGFVATSAFQQGSSWRSGGGYHGQVFHHK